MTDPRQTPRLMETLGEAVELASATEPAAYLERACGDDLALRDRVEGLIRARARAGRFLEAPAGPLTVDAVPEGRWRRGDARLPPGLPIVCGARGRLPGITAGAHYCAARWLDSSSRKEHPMTGRFPTN